MGLHNLGEQMLIFGNGEFAKVMQHYLCCPTVVHGFYATENDLVFERTEPQEIIIAVGYQHRKKIFRECMDRGFTVQPWVHGDCHMGSKIRHGVIIFELNNVQPFASIGENTVLWAGNHIGHHSRIGNHCFITSHVCIGGGAEIGDEVFIGMNATVFDHVKIGNNCIIAAGAVVDRDIPDGHTLSRKGVLVKHEMAQA